MCSLRQRVLKVQGGTGVHLDGAVAEPLQVRPFQSLVHLTDPANAAGAGKTDGTLHILPGFFATASRYFQLTADPPPEGGFTPLAEHDDLTAEALWVPARRLPSKWAALHATGKLPGPCVCQTRSVEGMCKKLAGLARELSGDAFGKAELPRAGDYTL